MKFLIVAPRYRDWLPYYCELPLGIMYISAVLKKAGYDVECLSMPLHYDEADETLLRRKIVDNKIDVLCTGGLSPHYKYVKSILNISRSIKPDLITIAGGGMITSEPEIMFDALRVDYGVIGEGEITIVELAEALTQGKEPNQVHGLIYRDSDHKIVKTPPRKVIADLDSLPYPDLEGFETAKYVDWQRTNDEYYTYPSDKPRILPIIASRGCPFSCSFCYHPLSKQYRSRSLDSLFREIEYLLSKYQINMLLPYDELFSVNKERLSEFCRRIKQYNLRWMIQIRVDTIDEEMLSLLKDSGCYYISYGIESASDKILKAMNKKITVAEIDKALELTQKYGIGIQGNLIFGNPEETVETAEESLNWWFKNLRYHINLWYSTPYPGSPDYHHCLEKGVIKDRLAYIETGCPVVNMSRLTNHEFSKLTNLVHQLQSDKRFKIFGNVLSSAQTGHDRDRNLPLYDLEVECPTCGHVNHYKEFHFRFLGFFKMACRNCNQRYDMHAEVQNTNQDNHGSGAKINTIPAGIKES